MRRSLKRQSGLTFIGLVFVLGIIALVTIFVLRLFPLYNEKLQIESAMQTVASQPDSARMSVTEARSAFMRALMVTNITRFNDRNVREHVDVVKPARAGEPPMLHVQYQATNKLFGDVQLLMMFDEQVPLANATGAGG